jgi:septation ring formation regulator EzrA
MNIVIKNRSLLKKIALGIITFCVGNIPCNPYAGEREEGFSQEQPLPLEKRERETLPETLENPEGQNRKKLREVLQKRVKKIEQKKNLLEIEETKKRLEISQKMTQDVRERIKLREVAKKNALQNKEGTRENLQEIGSETETFSETLQRLTNEEKATQEILSQLVPISQLCVEQKQKIPEKDF